MKIQCVTVCVNFDDYLSLTLDGYKAAFDEVVVVTTEEDHKTRELCASREVRAVLSDRVNYQGLQFNLPALVNDGFAGFSSAPKDWVIKIDPDIYLPEGARAHLESCLDDPELLWGAHRWFCETHTIFEDFVNTQNWDLLEPPYEKADPDVLGFFQLFNVGSSFYGDRSRPYEEEVYTGPSKTNDRVMSRRWPQDRRRRVPFEVIHLGLDAIGTNWKGRKAPRFF